VRECTCTPAMLTRYQKRISGALPARGQRACFATGSIIETIHPSGGPRGG